MLAIELFKMCFKKETTYKLNFILLCLAVAPLRLMFLLFAVILSDKIDVLYGWNAWDIAFLYGMYVVSYGLAQVGFKHFRMLDSIVKRGGLDQFMVKPQPVLFSLTFYNLHIMEIFSQFFPSVVVLIIASMNVNVTWNLSKIVVLLLSLFGATLIQTGIFVFIGSTAIFTFDTNWIGNLYYSIRDFLSYPIFIFGKELLVFFTYLIPLAFINYYPARYILEKEHAGAAINFFHQLQDYSVLELQCIAGTWHADVIQVREVEER